MLIAHNGRRFDIKFLLKEFAAEGLEAPEGWWQLDTLLMANEITLKKIGSDNRQLVGAACTASVDRRCPTDDAWPIMLLLALMSLTTLQPGTLQCAAACFNLSLLTACEQGTLHAHFGHPPLPAHRAMPDVQMMTAILPNLMSLLGLETIDALLTSATYEKWSNIITPDGIGMRMATRCSALSALWSLYACTVFRPSSMMTC